jgi:hypothetical protein
MSVFSDIFLTAVPILSYRSFTEREFTLFPPGGNESRAGSLQERRRIMGLNVATRIRKWELTSNATRVLAADFPFLQPEQLLLETTVRDLKLIQDQEEAARAQLEVLQRRRRTTLQEGIQSNNRLTALLRGHFGAGSEELIAYGIEPELSRRRRSTPPPVPPPPVGDELTAGSLPQ